MNNNKKSIKYTNSKASKISKDNNSSDNLVLEFLDIEDSGAYLEIEFTNHNENEIDNFANIISDKIKTKIDTISDEENGSYIDLDIDEGIKLLFKYEYCIGYEEYLLLGLQLKSNIIVIFVINENSIFEDDYNHYVYYSAANNDVFGLVAIYGSIGSFIEFESSNDFESYSNLRITSRGTNKEIAENIKKLEFLGFYNFDFTSFWQLYFILGSKFFTRNYENNNYFNFSELIPKKFEQDNATDFYSNICFIITTDPNIMKFLNLDFTFDNSLNINEWRNSLNSDMPSDIIKHVSDRLDYIELLRKNREIT